MERETEFGSIMMLPCLHVPEFSQEIRTFHGRAEGLPAESVDALSMDAAGAIYAYTPRGCHVLHFSASAWVRCPGNDDDGVVLPGPDGTPWEGAPPPAGSKGIIGAEQVFAFGREGLVQWREGCWVPVTGATAIGDVRDALCLDDGSLVLAAAEGVFVLDVEGEMTELRPRDATRAWHGRDARAVAAGPDGDLFLALPQGVACRHGDDWKLYEGRDGVPFCDFTCAAVSAEGVLWLGTTFGAIRFDGSHWAYRQGRRWLPHDHVRALCIGRDGSAWFATDAGVSRFHGIPMTLARKADVYEAEIERWHRRTVHGYVIEARTSKPGVKDGVHLRDSDNDGLWTAMYGAGECLAFAATGDLQAYRRAHRAWGALRFLGTVTQGGTPAAEPGFIARSILPAADGDPNQDGYTPAGDRDKQHRDRLWKVLSPRWPLSADGQWYWKADTSSDELDGHFFFYARYYDLVARGETEKSEVRNHACAIVDHLLRHDGFLIDHDGTPTRWGVFNPRELNLNPDWFAERGLNSLSILSYLATAHHLSGDKRYADAADALIDEHGYLQNLLSPKIHNGIGSGNQSDDEMAFMCYYNLIQYTHREDVRNTAAFSLLRYWRLEEPEMNPFFNVVYALCCHEASFSSPHSDFALEPRTNAWLVDAVETLKRFPLDRFNWAHTNSRRQDILPLHGTHALLGENGSARGMRVNGKVIPVDECFFNHWNYDPWKLDSGGDGTQLADGAVYLLPYYMALYHGLVSNPMESPDHGPEHEGSL